MQKLYEWLKDNQIKVPPSSAIAKAINYSEYDLENDEICKHELATLKDGIAHLNDLNIAMSASGECSKSINIVLEVGFKFPSVDLEGKSSLLISFKSKFEMASIVKNSFDFNLKVKF